METHQIIFALSWVALYYVAHRLIKSGKIKRVANNFIAKAILSFIVAAIAWAIYH